MITAATTQCRIANINVDLVEIYGRLCSLLYWKYFTEQLKRILES